MPTIGLAKVVYATITDGENGETYGEVNPLAAPTSVKIDVETVSGDFPAGDEVLYSTEKFKSGSLEIGVDDLKATVLADIADVTVDSKGVVVDNGDGTDKYVAVGLQSEKANGANRLVWLYRVKFSIPSSEYKTKEPGSVTFTAPTIKGTVYRRKKADTKGKHPWQAHVDTDDSKGQTLAETFLETVYEPTYTA